MGCSSIRKVRMLLVVLSTALAACGAQEEQTTESGQALFSAKKALHQTLNNPPSLSFNHFGTHKSPAYSQCGSVDCTDDFFRVAGCNPDNPSDACLDVPSGTADYLYFWATAAGGDTCLAPGGCFWAFHSASLQSQVSATVWPRIATIDQVSLYIVLSAYNDQSVRLSYFGRGGYSLNFDVRLVPGDGYGHKFVLNLPQQPSGYGVGGPWAKTDFDNDHGHSWYFDNGNEISSAHPGGLFLQSFTEVVYYR